MSCKPTKPGAARRAGGLTLIELLVAISVLGFVAVLGWRGLDSIARTRESLNHELEQTRGLQLAFAQMQTDCANAVDADTLDGQPPLVIEPQRFTLARRIQPEGQPTALQLVTYRLREGMLSREASPPTRDLQLLSQYAQFAQAGGALPVRLQPGVRTLQLRVWANDGRGWRAWPAPGEAALSSRGALMNPQAGTTATQTVWSGLEVSLQLQGSDPALTKLFMLGAE